MSKKAVLIIDDEPLLSMYLSDLVEDYEYDLIGAATSPQEARQLAQDRAPDIALVDVALQGRDDGIPVARELSERYGTAIILLSGYGEIAQRDDVRLLAPIAVLQKPCMPEVLAQALQDASLGREKKAN